MQMVLWAHFHRPVWPFLSKEFLLCIPSISFAYAETLSSLFAVYVNYGCFLCSQAQIELFLRQHRFTASVSYTDPRHGSPTLSLLLINCLFLIFTFDELFPDGWFLILIKYLERISQLAGRIMRWLRGKLRLTGSRMFFRIRILKDKEIIYNLNIKYECKPSH